MRTFGEEVDNLIDVELAYGANNYQITWYQNGLQRDIVVTKAVVHFVGAKAPCGNVTIDYLELNTEYLNFLEEDAIRIDVTEDDVTLTAGTYYVASFTKNEYDAFYTAYSSLINLGLKLDAWSNAPESAVIKDIVHHFIDPLDIVFEVEPSSTLTFNASLTDFSAITLGELLGYCACVEHCNYVLRGNVLCRVVPDTNITKEYNIDDVVYSENLSQITSDTTLDYIKVSYKTVSQDVDEEGQVSYDFNDAGYVCNTGTETCGFELNVGLVPISENELQSYFSTYFNSIKGTDCNGYDISFLGDARVEVGDKLKFSNDKNSAILNVSEITWEWDGGLKCTISSGSESNSSSESGFSIQQVVSQIQAMTNAVKNVQYNAVYANELYVKTAELGFATVKELSAEIAKMGLMTADQADIMYAKIDMSNIEKATIGMVLADIGLISDATIVNGHVTGYLDSVEVNANDITAGTLTVDRLVIRGSEKSIVYELNNITGAIQAASVDTLNGEIITPRTINADKIVANAITATELAVGSVTAEKILGYSITADKLNVTDLSAISANLGTVTAGIIKSSNYEENNTGMMLNLSDGSWTGKYFSISDTGLITATGGQIAGFNITPAKLYNDFLKLGLNDTGDGVEFVIRDVDKAVLLGIYTGGQDNYNVFRIMNFNEATIAAKLKVTNDLTVTDNITVDGDISCSRIIATYNNPNQIVINPESCTESSILYQTNGTSHWAVGHGCGSVGQDYFTWCSNTHGNVMTLSKNGYLTNSGMNSSGTVTICLLYTSPSPRD